MKLQLLPSTFDASGCCSQRQHLSCFVIDDCLAIDAGSLAMAATEIQKSQIRDVILTHAHLDHIAGLPLFIDDLFVGLDEPVRVYATKEVITVLEKNVFNWEIYPKFSELKNKRSAVMQFVQIEIETEIFTKHLRIKPVKVNHEVQTVGFLISDDNSKIAVTGDTTETDRFWEMVNAEEPPKAILVECAFPDELEDLAFASHHLTPSRLRRELKKLKHTNCPVYVINMKPMYRGQIVKQIENLKIKNLHILKVGKIYEW